MKINTLFTILGLLFLSFLFMSNQFGRAAGQNWGNTGAPGDQTLNNGQSRTCISCHGTGAIMVTLDIELLDSEGEIVANEYEPGVTYDVVVRLNHVSGPTPVTHGFQLIALDDATDTEINTWSEPANNVKFSFANNTSRTYPEQNSASVANTFNMKWTAPEAGTGSITFYSCGNGVNGNGGTSGDGAACGTLSLNEGEPSSTNNITHTFKTNLFPNPANDSINLEVDVVKSGEYKINIVNAYGKIISEQFTDFHTGTNQIKLNVTDFTAGIYFLEISNLRESAIYKWTKN